MAPLCRGRMVVGMEWRSQVGACAGLACLALAGTAPVALAAKPALAPITGELSAPGYTVLAMAEGGATTSVRATGRRFRLTPPAGRVTLHLRAPGGVYAGPIVIRVAKQGTQAIVGVRAGAKLGTIHVKPRRGYASVVGARPERWVDQQKWARAKNGVPLGAGNFGRVRSRPPGDPVPRDTDLDGIPDLLDIDDDGDRIIDKFDRSGAAPTLRLEAARATETADQFHLHSNLHLRPHETVNANAEAANGSAAALTHEKIDAALSQQGVLMMGILPGDSAELDCGQPQSRTDPRVGGLAYCSRAGTGRYMPPPAAGGPEPSPFPDAFDADGDGFGTMTPSLSTPPPGSFQLGMFLRHGATTAQIGTGDLLIQRVTRGGVETQYPATVQFIFATVPALVSYSDGQGNSATVAYPVAAPEPLPPNPIPGGPRPGGPGSHRNGFPVTAAPGAGVMVAVTLWRPQRQPIPPEAGEWIDIGGLNYSVSLVEDGASCPQTAYSSTDPNLRPLTNADVFPANYFGFRDLAPDRAASPANTFTFTFDLTSCLAGRSFNPGEERTITLNAHAPNGTDSAQQAIAFRRQ
jgi:hypothetical protein